AAAIEPANFSLANGADRAHIVQGRLPFLRVLPQAELGGRAPQHLLPGTAKPVYEGIIRQDISSVAHAENADENWAALERDAEPCSALPQPGLTGPQLRFGLLALSNVEPESQHVRYAVELNYFRGQEH